MICCEELQDSFIEGSYPESGGWFYITNSELLLSNDGMGGTDKVVNYCPFCGQRVGLEL